MLVMQVLKDAESTYSPGDVASVTFAGANPLNNLRPNGTFAQIQMCADDECKAAKTVADDGDWDTRLHVIKSKKDLMLTTRSIRVEWYIPAGVTAGKYRIVHHGTSYDDPLIGKAKLAPYSGVSKIFTVS